ncbi:acetate kinase [Saprolegnia parasitica CBS 223.65]|uniref:Probable acetate kinase n=1 Tax=Saprolegnia parasitica (strain CBS 223.65) TaxID=695850 RepID=A0A067CR29_SAPPC|nr:acetate kinase [Saprolegnia parasitica CBS 223.65]KDO33154.1 acetate kinase [Saprolegnia parasitica CBS 223.65]|eukprot:XP_012195919.1 acetate kinase [Saprolegnia parasitica CBS 223.65]
MDKLTKILVLNAGSSTLKYKLFAASRAAAKSHLSLAPMISGMVEIGEVSKVTHKTHGENPKKMELPDANLDDHKTALSLVIDLLCDPSFGGLAHKSDINAIGHRVVHGGERFSDASLITPGIMGALEESIALAPLHNPANILGIQVATELLGDACPQVAVFDTAFHATMPPPAFLYGLPYNLYKEHGVRRYGFHGTSHSYVAAQAAKHLNKPLSECNFITCHLGNGASVTAIKNGQSIDTSMGLTPLEGLVMGTRSGDIDPAIPTFLHNHVGMSYAEIDTMLNKKSGLLGLSGDADIRVLQDRFRAGDAHADLTLDVFAHRVRKYIGSYLVQLSPRLDGIIFTGGIGENSWILRNKILKDLAHVGVVVDKSRNEVDLTTNVLEVHADESSVPILVVQTDEEKSIAAQTYRIVQE